MRIYSTLLCATLAFACSLTGTEPTSEAVTVTALMSTKEAYAGRRITVEGRVHVMTLSGLRACQPGQPCPKFDDALLTLMDSRISRVPSDQLLRLYRRSGAAGAAEQIHCRIVDENVPTFDCGQFTPDAVRTVEGVFTKERVPDQTVVDATGHIQVLSYRDVYYLLID